MYALADALARFFAAKPEIHQAVTELMLDDSDSGVTLWNRLFSKGERGQCQKTSAP